VQEAVVAKVVIGVVDHDREGNASPQLDQVGGRGGAHFGHRFGDLDAVVAVVVAGTEQRHCAHVGNPVVGLSVEAVEQQHRAVGDAGEL